MISVVRRAPREDDGLNLLLEEGRRDARGFQGVGPSHPQRRIHHGWVVDDDVFLGARRSIQVRRDERHRLLQQLFGQFTRVGDGSRGEQEARLGSVEEAKAAQAAQDIGDIRTEDAAVDVQLVQHNPAQVLEQTRPARVVRKNTGMQHVGVGDQQACFLTNQPPLSRGRIAVVGADGERGGIQRFQQGRKRGRLIL